MKKYIVVTALQNHSIQDKYDLNESFNDDIDECYKTAIHKDFVQYPVDAPPLNIQKLKELINNSEKIGATHLAIDYHCDHDEYEFTSYTIKDATDDEVLKFLSKKKNQNNEKIQAEILALENKLAILKNQL